MHVCGHDGHIAMVLGAATLLSEHPPPSMGSEDFAYYLKEVLGCYVRFGACREGWENIHLHSPSFDFDEEVLKIGAGYFDEVVRVTIDEIAKGKN